MYLLEFTFDYQTVNERDVLYMLDKLAPQVGLKPDDYSQAHEVEKIERGKFSDLSGEVFIETTCGSIANLEHDFLVIRAIDIGQPILITFIELVAAELDATQAFLLDYEYHYWQNAQEIMEYKSVGRPYKHLPKTTRKLPPPLNDEIIDTSKNPGRYALHHGVREIVSSPMWVKKSFIKNMDAIDELATEVIDCGNLVKIVTFPVPFNSSEGEQKDIQNKLRNAVYWG